MTRSAATTPDKPHVRPCGQVFERHRPRNDFGAGLAKPSDDGGREEFDEDCFNRASSSAIRPIACSSRAVRSTTIAARSSYDGGG